MRPTATVRYIDLARELLDRVADQDAELDRAADLCADAIGGDGLVHVFGTGHSRVAVEEMFPRYGSYPGFHPIVELSMTFHTQVVGANGQRQAMFIERTEGLGEVILRNFDLRPPDAMMVFSAGGLGAVPIEIARGARERGLAVIAITSVAATEVGASTHSSGTRLRDRPAGPACRPCGLGGVSLAGGKGGLVGPAAAAFCLTLVPSIMVFQGIDPNYGQVIQGALIVIVVMLGGLLLIRERR